MSCCVNIVRGIFFYVLFSCEKEQKMYFSHSGFIIPCARFTKAGEYACIDDVGNCGGTTESEVIENYGCCYNEENA